MDERRSPQLRREDPTPEEFDRYARDYDAALQQGLSVTGEDREFYAAGRIRYLASLLRHVDRAAPSRAVLDFGCGNGASAPLLLEAFRPERIVGVDSSTASLEVARSTFGGPTISFAPADALRPDGSFDLCYTNGVFHHVPPVERSAVAERIRLALAPGGYLGFFENNPWNPGTRLVMSRIPFDRDARTLAPPVATALLRRTGFQVIATRFLFFFPAPLGALRSLERFLNGVPLGGQYLVLARRPR